MPSLINRTLVFSNIIILIQQLYARYSLYTFTKNHLNYQFNQFLLVQQTFTFGKNEAI